MKDTYLKTKIKKKSFFTISEFFTRFFKRWKKVLYTITELKISFITKRKKIVQVKTKGRADERKRERERGGRALFREGGSSANRWPAKTRSRREQKAPTKGYVQPWSEKT